MHVVVHHRITDRERFLATDPQDTRKRRSDCPGRLRPGRSTVDG